MTPDLCCDEGCPVSIEAETRLHCAQTSEESRKQYRKWLSAFTECAKALSDSRDSLRKAEEQVKERSEDMDKFVAGVKVFLSKEKSTRRAKRDKERTAR